MTRRILLLLMLSLLAPTASAQWRERESRLTNRPLDDEEDMVTNPFSNPEGIVDRLMILRGDDLATSAQAQRVKLVTDGQPRLVLDDDNLERYPRSGRWTSEEITTEFPFTEFIPSWNVSTPGETGFQFYARVRMVEEGEWSPWLYMGQWGQTSFYPARTIEFDHGSVHIDNIRLRKPAHAFQMRISFFSYDLEGKDNPSLRLLAASYSGVIEDKAEYTRLKEKAIVDGDWARSLPVPFYAQYNNGEAIRGETCSPTSTSMLISFHGIEKTPLENCMAIWDNEYSLFGNWSRAVAHASELGLDGWLTRVRELDQLKAYIAAGQPVIASIKFREGEFPSNPLESTNGHLIVVRGLTEDGDVIVNDPAHREVGNGIVYKWEELKNAWAGHGGVAYILRKPEG